MKCKRDPGGCAPQGVPSQPPERPPPLPSFLTFDEMEEPNFRAAIECSWYSDSSNYFLIIVAVFGGKAFLSTESGWLWRDQ